MWPISSSTGSTSKCGNCQLALEPALQKRGAFVAPTCCVSFLPLGVFLFETPALFRALGERMVGGSWHSPSLSAPSAGGVVTSGLAIYDTMQYILNPICTWCVGQAASMGSLLLAAGTPGMRHSLPNSRIMIHQPSGGARVSVP